MLRSVAGLPDAGASTSAADPQRMYSMLNEYLLLEGKHQPRLNLPSEDESGEVTRGARDGAAHVLRCLKVWHELPADVLVHAINLLDRFLTKMKVRPCHVPCITVSCMNIAIEGHAQRTQQPRAVSVEELVSVSQSACTAGDVCRMSRVISDKLSLAGGAPVTALHWLRLFTQLIYQQAPDSELETLLEIAVCDSNCANIRLSELALVLVYYRLEQQMVSLGTELPEEAYVMFEVGAQLQQHCRMSDASLSAASARLRRVVARYGARTAQPQRQRLVWRLSSRTLKVLRPTDRLTSLLPTIEEQQAPHTPLTPHTPPRNRSGSESSESEETSDWPRSPVLPVYCDN